MLEVQQRSAGICRHARTDRRVMSSDFFNQQFLAELDVCKDCGSQLWTADTQLRFQRWVEQLKQDHRDIFHVQFNLSESARLNLQSFLRRFPGVSMSSLLRTLITVYLASLTRFPQFQGLVDELTEGKAFRTFSEAPKARTNVQLSPVGIMDLQTWAGMLKLSTSKLIEEVVCKLLALQADPNPRHKQFWEENLLPYIELILRAV